MKQLQRLESWIAQLVEEPFVRLFASRLLPQDVATHLVRAMEDGEEIAADGVPEVPGRYRIALHPEDWRALCRDHPHVDKTLASALTSLVRHMNVRLRCAPFVELVADRQVPLHSVHITPLNGQSPERERTRDLDLSRLQKNEGIDGTSQSSDYLVIEGRRILDLTQSLISIGRALDNDLILEDRRVSRHHARLHRRHGRHVLQDLDSTGGTRVNGQQIRETVLHSGDLISLSGVELLYVAQGHGAGSAEAAEMDEETRATSITEG